MRDEQPQPDTSVERLCSEIQLFDLCDLDECGFRKSRYCTNEQLLKKFEAIKEEDDRQILLYDENELDDDESDFDELSEDFDVEDE